MKVLLQKIRNYISVVGASASETKEQQLRRKAFTLIAILKFLACFPWSVMYFSLGLYSSGFFPLTFAAGLLLNLLLFAKIKNYRLFVNISLFMMLTIPALLQWNLGGFENSGWIMIWSFLAPMGALVFSGKKQSRIWFAGFASVLIISVFTEGSYPARLYSQWVLTVFLLMNVGIVSTIVYATIVYFVNRANEENLKSEQLLLKILPAKIVNELKERGETMPLFYKSASVIFTDFVGFTAQSEKMKPAELVYELETCFSKFDDAARKYNVEKLKTIGDSYMCATGLPERVKTHPIDACLFGLEIQNIMKKQREEREKNGQVFWRLRLGIHSGPVVAGVIGKNKIAYDIWGDSVNTASRMESSGEEGKVNISSATFELVKDFFECDYRGKIKAKNKGEIDMYFIRSIKKDLSADGEGIVPNEEFFARYRKILNRERI